MKVDGTWQVAEQVAKQQGGVTSGSGRWVVWWCKQRVVEVRRNEKKRRG